MNVRTSVIVAAHNEGDELRATVDSLLASSSEDVEVVVVDDCSEDGSADGLSDLSARIVEYVPPSQLGVAGARNAGARLARGRTLVFCDGHVRVAAGWLEKLEAALERRSVGAVAPAMSRIDDSKAVGFGFTWTAPDLTMRWLPKPPVPVQPVPFLGGACVAVRRDVFDETGGFDEGCVHWGAEDAEFSLRLWRLGYECLIVADTTVGHRFREKFPYRVEWVPVLHNLLRLSTVHFDHVALTRVIDFFSPKGGIAAAYAQLAESDVWDRRSEIAELSVRETRSVFEQFRIEALL